MTPTPSNLIAAMADLLRTVPLDVLDADWHREAGKLLQAVEAIEAREERGAA